MLVYDEFFYLLIFLVLLVKGYYVGIVEVFIDFFSGVVGSIVLNGYLEGVIVKSNIIC